VTCKRIICRYSTAIRIQLMIACANEYVDIT
jgi:hypothetical protein